MLQTQLEKRLPAEFITEFPSGVAIAYSAIPIIDTIPEPTRTEVREAFAASIAVIWQVMIGVASIGLVASVFMKSLPLHTSLDENWGLEEAAKLDAAKSKDHMDLKA